jgi:hypothetical protein
MTFRPVYDLSHDGIDITVACWVVKGPVRVSTTQCQALTDRD